MSKLKIGIIGCGGIANQKHFPALKKLDDKCEMVAFCDILIDRAEKAAKEYGTESAKVYDDYKQLLADETIDVVHVLTPNVSHAPLTIDAFAAGKHVMCEKPMAATSADAKAMVDAWKKSGKKFTIGYQNRFRPEVQALKKACVNGELGEVYYGKAHAVRRRAVPTWGVFPNKALQGGGPLIDIGTHALDITLWMMDNYEPAEVMGSVFYKLGSRADQAEANMFGPWDPETFEVEDSAMGMIKMKDGSMVYLESSWALNILESKEASTTLCGTKAGAQINSGMSFESDSLVYNRTHNGQLTEETNTKGGAIAFFQGNAASPAVLEAKQWLDAIENDKQPLVKPEEALIVTEILEAIYKSAEEKREITF